MKKKIKLWLLIGATLLATSCRTFITEDTFIVKTAMKNPGTNALEFKYQYTIRGVEGTLYFQSNNIYHPGDTIKILPKN